MRYGDLMWKGRLASDLGVIVTDQVAYKRPANRTEPVTIPGRSGTVTPLGGDAWDEVVYSPGCALRPGVDPEPVWAWLRGRGRVIFGSMPNFAFEARFDDAFDCSELAAGHPSGYLLFTPLFICQPRRYEAIPTAAFNAGDTQRWNPGTLEAEPRVHLKASAGAVIELTVSTGETLRVTAPAGTGVKEIVVDMAMEAAISGGKLAATAGEYFRLPVGSYMVQARAVSGSLHEALIEPRYAWL